MRALEGTQQNPTYHAEGDVFIHTRMVLEELLCLPTFRQMSDADRQVTYWAALLHDVAKPACTREEDGKLTARGHSGRGERMARRILYQLGAPLGAREQVARLVQLHQVPYFALEHERPTDVAIGISHIARADILCTVAEADIRGRECADKQRLLDNVELFREVCRDAGCYEKPYAFASAHSRVEYFRRDARDPAYAAHDDTQFEVTLMSGLPGAGKDTWVQQSAPGLPVVSLDALREELGVAPEENQGTVVSAAKERARELLREERPFVWNATNVSRKLRKPLRELFFDYKARLRIVYVDTPWSELLRRSQDRAVPRAVLDKLLDRWEVPDETEAHEVLWIDTGG